MAEEDRTLSRNGITNFVLRIDLVPNPKLVPEEIAADLSKYFDRTEKRKVNHFNIHITQNAPEIAQSDTFQYVLVSESKKLTVTIHELHNAIILNSTNYIDSSIYKQFLSNLILVIGSRLPEAESKRIGLRYINSFKCDKPRLVSTVFGKRLSTTIKGMLNGKNQTRVIGVEEYIENDRKMRMQFGIPNRFYPSILTVFDLMLDIDSYADYIVKHNDWEETIATLNHSAYEIFKNVMNPQYIEKLK